MSIGIVALDPTKSYTEVANSANHLMYEAKQAGGDRIFTLEQDNESSYS